MEKQCIKCNELKSHSEFNVHKATKDGLNSVCKPCKNKVTKVYRETNPDKVKAQWKKHYNLHKKKEQPSGNPQG